MRTAVLVEPTEFELQDRSEPSPGPDDVLVAIRDVGICGSDVHYYEHGRIGDYVVEDPLVLGHESAGEVVAVGENVTGLEAGDRVALEPGVPCRRCAHCKRGDYHLCEDVTFMATPPHDGAFAEYVSWPADFAYELPDSVSTAEGALCEPLSVGIHACRRGDVGTGDTVLVTGAGPIGLLVMEAARAAGATDVIVTDVVAEKLSLAAERGADVTVDVTETDLESAVEEYTDGVGADVVVEASGAEPSIRSTLDAVRRGGTVVLVGLADEATVPFDVLEVIDNEIDVHGSFRYKNTYDAAVDLLADGVVDVAGIIDFESSLDAIDDAFQRAMEPAVVKGMITFES
ncbi:MULTISPECIES: NAD(P)-dependent alcohol dehydrogenase [Haloarcula]|uniref:L-threonine 3-dehydrogenase n=1 Tax=Haloarcula pellucida TaxID=1427151 RepID=A0A830GNW1_9EURY|nr:MULTISPECIES: NAD(P)-dependent alcohol dehydrogenase [Halomicroarcula]MBX0350208.1 NAD(P)-dependent alcohol dehydrogenase [Halomicroarcula pellucida]MDS0277690.1 NAD(P)-dependent alcohol dehydrogenase [Halomicroarcula sp. S1AR25-4]GGO00910.1 sorbitol dehydrogenase [Halomicroarcula pellucida]